MNRIWFECQKKPISTKVLAVYHYHYTWTPLHGMAWHCLLHSLRLWHFHCCELENLLSSIVLQAFFQSAQQLLPPIFINSKWLWHETVCVHFVGALAEWTPDNYWIGMHSFWNGSNENRSKAILYHLPTQN